jgi:hypothetical protein
MIYDFIAIPDAEVPQVPIRSSPRTMGDWVPKWSAAYVGIPPLCARNGHTQREGLLCDQGRQE